MPEDHSDQPASPKPQTPVTQASTPDSWQFFSELVRTILIVGIAAFLIRHFILQPFIVEGESMSPRFHTNDYLLVDKLSYRFHEPSRGDVVVFEYPLNTSVNYVKRVIGLPGETVTIANDKVTIKNAEHPSGFTLDEPYLPAGRKTDMLNGASVGTFTVPDNEYFVLGDNRPNSSDSREWGLLPKSDVIGRVILRAYPFNEFGPVTHATYATE